MSKRFTCHWTKHAHHFNISKIPKKRGGSERVNLCHSLCLFIWLDDENEAFCLHAHSLVAQSSITKSWWSNLWVTVVSHSSPSCRCSALVFLSYWTTRCLLLCYTCRQRLNWDFLCGGRLCGGDRKKGNPVKVLMFSSSYITAFRSMFSTALKKSCFSHCLNY